MAGLLHEITEGRMTGKPTRGTGRIQMLQDMANDHGCTQTGSKGQRRMKTQRK